MDAGLAAELLRLLEDDPPPLFDAWAFAGAALFDEIFEDFFAVVVLPERAADDDGLADAGAALERLRDAPAAAAGLEAAAALDPRFAVAFDSPVFSFDDGALFEAGELFGEALFVEELLAEELPVAALFGEALPRLDVRLGAALRVEAVLREDAPAGAADDFFFGEALFDEVFDDGAEDDRAGEELLLDRLDDEPAEERLLFGLGFSWSTMPTFSATDFTASLITCVTLPATSLTVSVTLSSARATGDAADRDFLAAMILSSTFINNICRCFITSINSLITIMNAPLCIHSEIRQERCRSAYHTMKYMGTGG